jgi:hypothetical protein
MALPNERQSVYLSQSVRLPLKLTLTQFVWMMEIIVAAAVFSGIVGKRSFLADGTVELLTSATFFTLALGLYFLPVYLAKLWVNRYFPRMPLLSPTDTVVTQSLPGVLAVSTRRKGPGR